MRRATIPLILMPVIISFSPGPPPACSDRPLSPDPLAYVAPDHPIDVVETRLNLDLDIRGKKIKGYVIHRFVPRLPGLKEIRLNCVDLEVDSVYLQGETVDFVYPFPGSYETTWMDFVEPRRDTELLLVRLDKPLPMGQELALKIVYHGSPVQGLYFIRPEKGLTGKRYEVWSQGEGEDNRYWIPCFDYPNDRAAYEGVFTVEKGYYVVSNGVMVEKQELEDKVRYRWRLESPQVSYLIMVAAGKYKIKRERWKDVDLLYIVPPGTDDAVIARSFGLTPDMMEFFSSATGIKYPYKKYAQIVVQNFLYGGMENTTATVLNERALISRRASLTNSSQGLIAHELAHQWWGGMVTCREWNHIWLNEGFATYFEALYNAYHKGQEEFRYQMDRVHRSVVERDQRDPRPMVVEFFNRIDERNSNNVYVKGASVLHMLRKLLGDSLFFACLKRYGQTHRFGLSDTHDLVLAVKETTGLNLDWFFEQWVYLAGHPSLRVSKSWNGERGTLRLTVVQRQKREGFVPLFRLPVDVEVTCRQGKFLFPIVVSKAEQDFYFQLPSQPEMVIFDKGDWTLKEIEFPKPLPELLYQAKNGEAIERIQAVRALADGGGKEKAIEALAQALHNDPFWGVRKEAALSLGKRGGDEARAALLAGLNAEEAKVRMACARALGRWREDGRVERKLAELFARDPAYDVAAEALRSLVRMGSDKAKKLCLSALDRPSYREVIRKTALDGLVELEAADALARVRRLASPGNPRLYRDHAIRACGLLAATSSKNRKKKTARFLARMLEDWNLRTREAVIDALAELAEPSAIEDLQRIAASDPVEAVRNRARKAVERIRASVDKDRKEAEGRGKREALEKRLKELEKEVERLKILLPEGRE